MKEFFENLRELREKKGITLEEIAHRSLLQMKFLEAIEDGKLDELPQGYDRIYFKRYLKEIKEDKPDVWRDFDLFFGKPVIEEGLAAAEAAPEREEAAEADEETESGDEKTSVFEEMSLKFNMDQLHRTFWLVVVVIALSVIGYFAYQQYVFVSNSKFQIREVSVAEFIEEMQKQDSLLTPTLVKQEQPATMAQGEVSVVMKALHRTWVREIRDETDTTDYILPEGLSRTINGGQSLQFVLGRADGVNLWVNGDSLGQMGRADEIVVNLLVTPEGITDKKLRKSKNSSPAEDSSKVTSAKVS